MGTLDLAHSLGRCAELGKLQLLAECGLILGMTRDKPDRRAIRDAYLSVRNNRFDSADEVRTALHEALSERNTTVRESTLEVLVDAIQTSPTRAWWRVSRRIAGAVKDGYTDFRKGSIPTFLNTLPGAIEVIGDSPASYRAVRVILRRDNDVLLRRILSQAPRLEGNDYSTFFASLVRPSASPSCVEVYAGVELVGELSPSDSSQTTNVLTPEQPLKVEAALKYFDGDYAMQVVLPTLS